MTSTIVDQNGGSSSSSPTTVLNTGLSSSAAVKGPCRVAAGSAITLSGEQSIDGVAIVEGDRVLVTAQASSVANGIYIASTGAWSRAQDFNRNDDVRKGTQVRVTDGSSYSGLWVVTSADPITIDTTAITLSRDTGLTNGALLAANNFSDLASAIAGWDALARYTGSVTASGGVLDLSAATAPLLTASGNITSITLGTAKFRLLRTSAALTITSSATLIVNGGIVSARVHAVPSGALLMVTGEAASVVRVDVIGFATQSKGAAIASAATVTLTPNATHHITGNTTITDIDFSPAADGAVAWVVFDGALTLTHNGTTLLLPGAANITTVANDRALFMQDSADNVYCLAYIPATVTGSGGSVRATSPTLVTPTLGVAAATSININSGGAVSALLSGTYTPTLTNTTNVDASVTNANVKYSRIGNIVSVFGEVQIDPTLAAPTSTVLNISLPIASNLAAASELSGTANDGVTSQVAIIRGNITSDTAEVTFQATSTTNRVWTFSFAYMVI